MRAIAPCGLPDPEGRRGQRADVARPAYTPMDTTTTGVRVDHSCNRSCMWRNARYGLSNTGPAIGRSKALSLAGVWEMVEVRAGAAPAPVPQSGTGADRRQR